MAKQPLGLSGGNSATDEPTRETLSREHTTHGYVVTRVVSMSPDRTVRKVTTFDPIDDGKAEREANHALWSAHNRARKLALRQDVD